MENLFKITVKGTKEDVDVIKTLAIRFGMEICESAKSYTIEDMRLKHENAYKPWTYKDDEKLEIYFVTGKKVSEIAEIFGRNEGAIRSRIKKLELEEKYKKNK